MATTSTCRFPKVPELPEVETVARSIAPLVGRRIVSAEFRCTRILRGGDPDHMAARLQGRKIAAVKRYGKFILVSLRGGGYLVIHLGMTGRLLLGGERGKHTHAILTLDRGVLLYDDSRQFGCLQFSEEFPHARCEARSRAAGGAVRGVRRRPQAPQDAHQSAAAEPDLRARRRQHLCG